MKTKKIAQVFLLITLIFIVMIGCKKDDDNNNVDPSSSGTIQLDIDGANWKPTKIEAASAFDIIAISGDDGTYQQILFSLPKSVTTGTYDLENNIFGATAIIYQSEDEVLYYPISGTLKITKHNTATNELEGTFSFEASDMIEGITVSISNGSFDLNYLEVKK